MKLKNALERLNSRPEDTEEQISDLADRGIESTQAEEGRIKRSEVRVRELRDNVRHPDIPIIGDPEGEEREERSKIFI